MNMKKETDMENQSVLLQDDDVFDAGWGKVENPDTSKAALVLSPILEKCVEQVIHEYRQRRRLKSHGLTHRRKLLLVGPSGTGKTMTTEVLAYELKLPLYTIDMGHFLVPRDVRTKFRQIFDRVQNQVGVYNFDKFDTIGVEEDFNVRQIFYSFLQFMNTYSSDSLVLATGSIALLSSSLVPGAFRYFDDVLQYKEPSEDECLRLIKKSNV